MANPFDKSVNRRGFLAGVAGAAAGGISLLSCNPAKPTAEAAPLEGFIVPNFHPASCGWLTNFSNERVYCANSYLDHLDRVRDDPTYKFVLSECNNLIAIMNFQPARIEEIKQRAKEGRVELVNATFLEMGINLSGGEALIKEGVEGLRWQEQVMGASPRIAWTIDICGQHDQMGQICAGLGLQAMVYCRMNRTGSRMHWAESPDGSRILALCPEDYSDFGPLFGSKDRLTPDELRKLEDVLREKAKTNPAGAPILILGGHGDYSLAPVRQEYPQEFLEQWKQTNPHTKVRMATAGEYLDAVLPDVKSGKIQIPTMKGGTGYTFDSFWIENPRVKTWYRKNEHGLQAAETLATIASLSSKFPYPVDGLYKAWVMMLLNTDRNTLWGSAGGMVYESKTSWDVRDRMEAVEGTNKKVHSEALSSLTAGGEGAAFFNPLNWERHDPVMLEELQAKGLEGSDCQTVKGKTLCGLRLPSLGIIGIALAAKAPEPEKGIQLPASIETKHYSARIDPNTGALTSLKLKPSGREVLGGGANVLVAEKPKSQKGDPGDFMLARPGRTRLASSSDSKPTITVAQGPLATTVEIAGKCYGGGPVHRLIRFYENYPRIDFETELNDIPDLTVVVAEFPLAADVDEVRRAIPNGFSHGAWAKPNPELPGWTKGIVPAVGWIHYTLAGGGGVAILDRGLSGRELNDRTPTIYLLNATDKYYGWPNPWLSGKGKKVLTYALVAHDETWDQARIPQMAWEYNNPPIIIRSKQVTPEKSFVQTSSNVIVSVIRREGKEIEMRLVECLGHAGTAEVSMNLPHQGAALTDLRGRNPQPLQGGPTYRFPVAPQQIVTMHFHGDSAVEEIKPILKWDDLVPAPKRAALHQYGKYKGHPPRGDNAPIL
ncbi:MAG TPA: glycoside hydrolase family 38 C-terminal domain-containing protein [Terriglobia bacterium]|nr:glycoside hydrolase family 38 C-terminal domain-containing protein [Terriglobia bacterium]